MSGLEVLGLVANIFQVISFSAEAIRVCKAVYDGREPPGDELKDHAMALQTLASQVEVYCQKRTPKGADERKLEDLARKCAVVARALQEEVQFVTVAGTKGAPMTALRATFRTLWRKNRLNRLRGSLQRYQETMESHLLFRVW